MWLALVPVLHASLCPEHTESRPLPQPRGGSVDDMPDLLDDQAMWDFVVDGYTVVHADLPREFHAQIHRDTEAVFAERGNVGNAILAEHGEGLHHICHNVADVDDAAAQLASDGGTIMVQIPKRMAYVDIGGPASVIIELLKTP